MRITILRNGPGYLNTYHVKVQCKDGIKIKLQDKNLNTYHVKVQCKQAGRFRYLSKI
mgnify:CR=1 FL=1